jgi:hypothetical protein
MAVPLGRRRPRPPEGQGRVSSARAPLHVLPQCCDSTASKSLKKTMPVTMGEWTVLGDFPAASPADTPEGSDTEASSDSSYNPFSAGEGSDTEANEAVQRLIDLARPSSPSSVASNPSEPSEPSEPPRQGLNEELRQLLALLVGESDEEGRWDARRERR